MTPSDLEALTACIAAPNRVLTQPQTDQRLSRDFYWYSPVLKKLLDDKTAEAVVQPISTAEIVQVLRACYARNIPVTARGAGWELRCYPSTLAKASLGGFLGGGSGGIGSIAHGGLRDFQTVRAIEVVTMEPEPRVVLHEGESVHDVLHAWG
jgi:FAD/FMN-containing dehydrogenase